jgi:hypothetical protein
MKNQIFFTLVVFAVTLFLSGLVGCTTQPKPLDQRNTGFELIVKKDSLQKYVAFFDSPAQCAITGMDYKKQGFTFFCESLKPADCAEKYDYFNQVKACLDKQTNGWQ